MHFFKANYKEKLTSISFASLATFLLSCGGGNSVGQGDGKNIVKNADSSTLSNESKIQIIDLIVYLLYYDIFTYISYCYIGLQGS